MVRFVYCVIILSVWVSLVGGATVEVKSTPVVHDLRCEYLITPLGLDTNRPRFYWIVTSEKRGLHQNAYQILVASNPENLKSNKADMWDSGKVVSDQSIHVRYAGKALDSGGRYYWKVRIWDQTGQASAYSGASWFEMALLKPEDWTGAWIGPANEPPVIEKWKVKLNNKLPSPVPSCAINEFDDSEWLVLQSHKHYDKYGADHHSKTGDPLETQVGYAWYRTRIHADKDTEGKLSPKLLYFRKALQNVWIFVNGELVMQTADDTNFAFHIAPYLRDGENLVALCIQRTNPHEHHPGGLRTKVKMGIEDNLLRKSFAVGKQIKRARAYISGLGYYELRINGEKVGDHQLDPGWTDYKKSTIYSTYDITDNLKTGKNAIGVMLGHGHYSGFGLSYGNFLKMILQVNIDFTDGTSMSVVSDDSWKSASGPVIADHIFHGEKYDARLEKPGWDSPDYDDSDWNPTAYAKPNDAVLKAQHVEPIKEIQTITPVKMTNPKEGVYVFDLGQNIAGWARLKVKGPAGTNITLKYTELLKKDGTVDRTNIKASARSIDEYVLKGKGVEIWQPRFTYHGFRYIEMTGYPGVPMPDTIEGVVVHSSVAWTGKFACSNKLINRIQQNVTWTVRDNFHSVPGSCCNRGERAGWGGDAQVMLDTTYYNFGMANLYDKFMEDYAEDQNPKGGVHDSIPWTGWGGYSAPGWHDCYTLIAWTMYQHYGDSDIIRKHYTRLKLALKYILDSNPELIWVNGIDGNYGDWGSPVSDDEHKALLATCNFYQDAVLMSRMAGIIGENSDAKSYAALAEKIVKALNDRFFNPKTNQYAGGAQAANAFALYLGIVPEGYEKAVADNLVNDVVNKNKNHLTTGPQGTRYVPLALTMTGHADVAYALATQTTKPSWGYMIANDATTLWEFWSGGNGISHNHPFLGSISEWFYRTLAGINIDPEGPGYEKIIIKPYVLGDLTWAKASVKTIRGLVASGWEKQGDMLTLKVVIPANSTADVYVPKLGMKNVVVKEGGKIVWHNGAQVKDIPGITAAKETAEYVRFETGSGSYRYEIAEAAIADAN